MLKTTTAVLFLLTGGVSAFAQAPAQPPAAQAPAAATEAPALPPLPVYLNCTFTKAYKCDKDKGCNASENLGGVELPARFLIHFGERVIVSVDKDDVPHLSTIHTVSGAGPALTLQGTDGEVGWVLQLSRADNDVTLTTTSDDTILTAFGSCTPPAP